jgi:acetylornithine deacetylase/succinyl-diaminopimelate desuccinylase-like protein
MNQIERWQQNASARAALAALADTEAIVQTTIAVQQIAAPTFAEQERGAYVATRLRELSLHDVDVDELGNVYSRRAGRLGGPGLLIAAHLDTVFPADVDLSVRREDGRVYGPGIGDNSLAVAALLHLAAALQQQDVPHDHDIWFVATVGEEGLGDLRGMRAAVDRLQPQLAAAIALEGMGNGRVIHAGLGVRRYQISASAAGGHSWSDFGAPSAVHALVRLAARLSTLTPPADIRSSYNIGVIEGGTSVNTIAERASLLLDLRSVAPAGLAALVEQVERLTAEARASEPEVTFTLEIVGDRPAGRIAADHALVRAAVEAGRASGLTLTNAIASTDANIPLSRGLPAVCVGVTAGDNAHRLDEYIETAPIRPGMQALLWLTLAASSADRD